MKKITESDIENYLIQLPEDNLKRLKAKTELNPVLKSITGAALQQAEEPNGMALQPIENGAMYMPIQSDEITNDPDDLKDWFPDENHD